MKRVVVDKPNSYKIIEEEKPQIKDPYDVIVKMKSAGVCGSDHHLYHGLNPNSTYPRTPGHENAGIVVEKGDKVTNVDIGDHVIIDLISTCGECYQCKTGRKNVCENVKVRGSGADGGWVEYILAPAKEVYKISKDIKWEDAALVEPFAIGGHCTGRGNVRKTDKIFILGVGTIGSIIIQTCKAIGCQTIIACDIDSEKLERAKKYGASHVINSKEEDIISKIQEITEGKGVNVAFDSACYKGSMALCLQEGILANAGVFVPLGFVTDTEPISQAMINKRELTIAGSRMSQNQFEKTIKNMEDGKYITEGVATTFINFNEIDKVFYNMDNPSKEVKKMVILFD